MLVLLVGSLAGCDKLLREKDDDALTMAHSKEKEGDYQEAIRWYEDSLDGTAKGAEAQYSMALIYDDKLDNPLAALAHFRRYLELAPHGAHAKDAQNFADQDEFKLANTLSKGNFMPQQDAARLKNANIDLQKQLAEARKEVTDLHNEMKDMVGKGGHLPEPVQKPIPPGALTYTVESGDTLRSISRKFFKTPGKWQDIQDANFNSLAGTVKLRVGMTLVIPKK